MVTDNTSKLMKLVQFIALFVYNFPPPEWPDCCTAARCRTRRGPGPVRLVLLVAGLLPRDGHQRLGPGPGPLHGLQPPPHQHPPPGQPVSRVLNSIVSSRWWRTCAPGGWTRQTAPLSSTTGRSWLTWGMRRMRMITTDEEEDKKKFQ